MEQWYQLFNNKANTETNADIPVIFAWQMSIPAPKQPVVAVRNPYYWKVDTSGNQLPYLDRLEWMIVEKIELVNMRAMAGDVDMQLRNITFDNYPVLKQNQEKGGYRLLDWQWGDHEIILQPNVDHADPVKNPILADKRFRWALSLGINRQEVCDSIYLGTTKPTQGGPMPGPFYWEEYTKNKMEYDPAQANKLLDEMGLNKKDADGYRLMPNGQRLTIYYNFTGLFGAWRPTGELLTQHYKKIGIELILKEEARDLFYEHFQARQTDISIWTGAFDVNPLMNPSQYLPYKQSACKWAPDYALWNETNGAKGKEPPAGSDIRKTLDIWAKLVTVVDQEEQKSSSARSSSWPKRTCGSSPSPPRRSSRSSAGPISAMCRRRR